MDHQKIDYSGVFKGGSLINIKIKPDSKHTEIPADLKHMINKVSNLNIDGENLEELQYVNDELYKPAILLERIKIEYEFKHEDDSGVCIAEIGFPSTLNSKSVDYGTILQCSIEIPKRRRNHRFKTSSKILMNVLSRKISEIANEKYKLIKS